MDPRTLQQQIDEERIREIVQQQNEEREEVYEQHLERERVRELELELERTRPTSLNSSNLTVYRRWQKELAEAPAQSSVNPRKRRYCETVESPASTEDLYSPSGRPYKRLRSPLAHNIDAMNLMHRLSWDDRTPVEHALLLDPELLGLIRKTIRGRAQVEMLTNLYKRRELYFQRVRARLVYQLEAFDERLEDLNEIYDVHRNYEIVPIIKAMEEEHGKLCVNLGSLDDLRLERRSQLDDAIKRQDARNTHLLKIMVQILADKLLIERTWPGWDEDPELSRAEADPEDVAELATDLPFDPSELLSYIVPKIKSYFKHGKVKVILDRNTPDVSEDALERLQRREWEPEDIGDTDHVRVNEWLQEKVLTPSTISTPSIHNNYQVRDLDYFTSGGSGEHEARRRHIIERMDELTAAMRAKSPNGGLMEEHERLQIDEWDQVRDDLAAALEYTTHERLKYDHRHRSEADWQECRSPKTFREYMRDPTFAKHYLEIEPEEDY